VSLPGAVLSAGLLLMPAPATFHTWYEPEAKGALTSWRRESACALIRLVLKFGLAFVALASGATPKGMPHTVVAGARSTM